MTEDLKNKFLNLACRLSPENLHCDGEISRAQAERKRKAIMKEWAALEKEAGRTVDQDEPWSWA